MCYSIEVQLTTSLIIIGFSLFYYFYYSHKYKNDKRTWITRFLTVAVLGALFIGFHQFFEFLTLVTNNIWVYKVGLIISVSALYFLLKSLEILSNRKIYSWIALIVILAVSLQILFSPMTFADKSFYVVHSSAFFWIAAFLLLFIYWHVCAFKIYSETKDDKTKKTVILYMLTTIDIGFILSALYVFIGHFIFSVNVCTDAPSIWCTFSTIQAFFIPYLFYRLDKAFKRNNAPKKNTVKQTVLYLVISFIVLILLILIMPLFNCLTWNFIFP